MPKATVSNRQKHTLTLGYHGPREREDDLKRYGFDFNSA